MVEVVAEVEDVEEEVERLDMQQLDCHLQGGSTPGLVLLYHHTQSQMEAGKGVDVHVPVEAHVENRRRCCHRAVGLLLQLRDVLLPLARSDSRSK